MVQKSHRIVIRRPPAHEPDHHGGSWKIAYADFMTAMMSFFLVMWLLTLIPREDLPGIAEYFKRPLFPLVPTSDNSASPRIIPGGSPSIIPNPSGSDIQTPNVQGSSDSPDVSSEPRTEAQRLEDLKERLETLIATNPRLQEFSPQMVLDMTPEGLRIQIVDGQNKPMFDLGSANMRPDMRTILTELASTLNNISNQISIAGHTDATRYASGERAYSNWELSADRANAARRALVAGGLAENKVQRIMGLASNMAAHADPYAHANRRISIVVLNHDSMDKMVKTYANVTDVQAVKSNGGSPIVAPTSLPLPGWPGANAAGNALGSGLMPTEPLFQPKSSSPDLSWSAPKSEKQ